MADYQTDVPNVYRYVNCNRQWLRLRKGVNYIEITGKMLFII